MLVIDREIQKVVSFRVSSEKVIECYVMCLIIFRMKKFTDTFVCVLLTLSFCYNAAGSEPPCKYFRSVNITGAVITSNGSAIFEGTEYRNGSYGQFNNSFFESVQKSDINKTHMRGCFCHLPGKPCLQFCCPKGFLKRAKDNICYPYSHDVYINTSSIANNYTTIKVEDKYRMVQSPCKIFSFHVKNWELFKVIYYSL